MTPQDLQAGITLCNVVFGGAQTNGTFSYDARRVGEAADFVSKLNFTPVSSGPLAGSEYAKTEHGYVVKSAKNLFSLIETGLAQTLGLP
jgi:hypothetical protein